MAFLCNKIELSTAEERIYFNFTYFTNAKRRNADFLALLNKEFSTLMCEKMQFAP